MPEKFTNNAVTTMNQIGGIDAVTNPVTFAIANAVGFPTTGNFRIIIDTEILLVTSVSGDSFTASRGQEGTPTTAHDNGATVRHILTAGALTTKFSEMVLTGLYANLPAAGVSGRQYYCTDSPYSLVDTGSAWKHFINGFYVTPPVIGDFSWVNQGTATASATIGGLLVQDATANSSSFDVAQLVRTAPSPTYSVVIGFIPFFTGTAYTLPATLQRESSSGKIITLRYGTSSGMTLEIVLDTAINGTTSSTSVFVRSEEILMSYPVYIKLVDDATDRKYYISSNPFSFPLLFYTEPRTTYATPNQVGFSINTYNQPQAAHWIHYSEGP